MNMEPARRDDGLLYGVVAHTADNPTRRYFEPHPPAYVAHGGEHRSWGELINPRRFKAGCGVRP